MPWFRLDDGFHSHPKVLRAGNAAVGLWVRCATWSADQGEDGHVDPIIAQTYGTRTEMQRLIDSRLWVKNGAGFVIPDFLEFNPSDADVKARRADETSMHQRGGIARARGARRDEHGHFIPKDTP